MTDSGHEEELPASDAAGRPPAAMPRTFITPRREERPWRESYAALDLGTNNCRLLIAEPARAGFRVVDAFSRAVRLGQGIAESGTLSSEAIARTLAALKVCAGKIRRRHVTRQRAVATQACRLAGNCEGFLEAVKAETGIELEIITSREEAYLANCGCAPLVDPDTPWALVFDIGGGSTEVSLLKVFPDGRGQGRPARLSTRAWCSIPIGVVTLAERYGGAVVPPPAFARMKEDVHDALAPFETRRNLRRLIGPGSLQMLGTSGTVTTITGVHKRLPRYDRLCVDGTILPRETALDVSHRIARMSYEERVAEGCIGADRADLVIAGCAILEAICELWPVSRLRVADRGLREGILLTLIRDMGRERRLRFNAGAGRTPNEA